MRHIMCTWRKSPGPGLLNLLCYNSGTGTGPCTGNLERIYIMAKMYWFLRVGDDSLDEAKRYSTKATAVWKYQQVAQELARYGQEISASLHQACTRDLINEYPDYVLALGPRGGVQVQST